MRKIITPVKGTRDFYPDLMAVRTWLYDNLRKVSESFGYQEYEAPFLETLALYAAKSGEELVKEQSYVFEDRSGDSIALRPELTPSLARMIAQKENELTFPVRWWSFGPFWRYERPQKGRTREFFQWNVDLLGVNSPEADAELIAVAASFFKRVGLKPDQSRIYVNNRRLMESQFTRLGFTRDMHPVVSNIVDRRSKLGADKWNAYALEEGLTNDQLVDLKNLLDNKNIWHESDELVRLFATLKALNVCDFVEFDANIMRGLLADEFMRDYLRVNDYEGKTWFGKESYETALMLLMLEGVMEILAQVNIPRKTMISRLEKLANYNKVFKNAAQASGYDLKIFLEKLNQS